MAGTRGPIPKRSEARIRRNAGGKPTSTGDLHRHTDAPFDPDPEWHTIAQSFWEALENSGQSAFYADSDWVSAYLLCEVLTRELKPQFIGWKELPTVWGENSAGERVILQQGGTAPVAGKIPIKGASLNAIRAQMAVLLVNEGDRRRLSMELSAGSSEPAGPSDGEKAVSSIMDKIAQRQAGGGKK